MGGHSGRPFYGFKNYGSSVFMVGKGIFIVGVVLLLMLA
jgi:hypothetical protein